MSLTDLGERIVGALPPAMLLLVLLNVGMMAAVWWTVGHNVDARNELLTRIIESCLLDKQKP